LAPEPVRYVCSSTTAALSSPGSATTANFSFFPQVFSVLESTYQHDTLRHLLDYFVPAKHLLHKLQQPACSQYLGCLFLHSGWPLCLGEKVVVQLSTLDWRLLRSNDFYLQVVPFSTRCPRLALKCLAPGGRTVQEILVPESQHPLVFTTEWLHSVNKERGHRRLDTCLVSTCDGVLRLPWKEVVYPKFIHDPSEELSLMSSQDSSVPSRMSSEPDGLDSAPALPSRRRSEDGLGRTARNSQVDGDYVELLEPRLGPDGGVDTQQRYLEMHGICKTKTLPLCRRGKAIKLRKGRAWGHGRLERSGSFRSVAGARREAGITKDDILRPQPLREPNESARGRRSCSSSVQTSDDGDVSRKDSEGLERPQLYFNGPVKERRPGVGKERDSNGLAPPCRDEHKCEDSEGGDNLATADTRDPINRRACHASEGHSDQGSHSDSVFEDADKPPSGGSDATTPTSDTTEKAKAEPLPVCNGQSGTSLLDHSDEEATPGETSGGQINGLVSKEPPLLRELNPDLLQSGKFKLTGTVDRLGRALVITETKVSEGSFCPEEMARVLACYHRITRPAAKEKGLTVVMDSRGSSPSALLLSALKLFQSGKSGEMPFSPFLCSVSHGTRNGRPSAVRGQTAAAQRDGRRLPALSLRLACLQTGRRDSSSALMGEMTQSLESLTERCKSALCLLGEALRSMDSEPVPDNIKAVPLSIDKHRQLMVSVLADQRITELQQRGGAWLAGLTNSNSGLAQKAALAATSELYDGVDDALHKLVWLSNQKGRDLESLGRLAELVDKLDKEIERVQSQLEEYREPPLSLSRLSLKQQKFKSFRETANIRVIFLGQISNLHSRGWTLGCWSLWIFPSGAAQRDSVGTQRFGRLERARLDRPERHPDPPSARQGEAAGHVPLLASLPPIPPSRFQDARSLALELGGGALLDLWTQTVERYQRTVAHVKPRFLQSDRGQNQGQGEADWGLGAGGGDGGLQSWGSLASLFRPQTCSTLKIGEDKGNKKTRLSPPAWLRPSLAVLIRGVEVSSKEVVDHTGSPRQHVLLGRTEREMGADRAGSTTQRFKLGLRQTFSKLYLLWCRMLSSERQYVAVLKGVEETYLPLLELSDTPASIRGKADALFPTWTSLSSFHSHNLLPAMEGALVQSLLQQDCFSKYRDQFLQYSHYIRTKPDLDSPLVTLAKPIKGGLESPLSFPHCLGAPVQRLEQYCEALEELGGINPACDSALSILRHAQRHGEDLRASDLILGCPIPVAERGDLVRQGELTVCGGPRRKRAGVRNVFLYQHVLIFTKLKSPSPGRTVYSYKHSIRMGEMGLTQDVGEEGVKFEVWVRHAARTRDCITLQAKDRDGKAAWTHDVAHLLWTHAINNTELCLKESLCVGISSKLLLD
uniref:Rho guanine nucleotide exchange factor (GEF) 40 n=1 Tax=Tetraodon nigroviridis TaxID=99883 RepID=H3CPP4_TETNG